MHLFCFFTNARSIFYCESFRVHRRSDPGGVPSVDFTSCPPLTQCVLNIDAAECKRRCEDIWELAAGAGIQAAELLAAADAALLPVPGTAGSDRDQTTVRSP